MTRRAMLVPPLLLAACGGDPEPPRPSRGSFPPLRYGYLPPLTLNVRSLAMDERFVPPTGGAEVSQSAPVNVADTVLAMGRDRLKAAGTGGRGTFRIQTASIIRRGDTLDGTLAVRLDLRDAEDTSTGFVEARATAAKIALPDQRAALYDLLKSLMDEMNVELEYQIKRELRGWLMETRAPQGRQSEERQSEGRQPETKQSGARRPEPSLSQPSSSQPSLSQPSPDPPLPLPPPPPPPPPRS